MPRLETSPHNSLVITNLDGPVKEFARYSPLLATEPISTKHLAES
jgi:hypothetical protein